LNLKNTKVFDKEQLLRDQRKKSRGRLIESDHKKNMDNSINHLLVYFPNRLEIVPFGEDLLRLRRCLLM